MTFSGGEFGSEEIFTIHEMDGFAFAEGGFEHSIIGFPRYYLRVGA